LSGSVVVGQKFNPFSSRLISVGVKDTFDKLWIISVIWNFWGNKFSVIFLVFLAGVDFDIFVGVKRFLRVIGVLFFVYFSLILFDRRGCCHCSF